MAAFRTSTLHRALKSYTGEADTSPASGGALVPSARALYHGAINAKFPAHQVNGIWHYDPADLPVIAAAYGLLPKSEKTPQRQNAPSTALHAAA